MNAVKWNEIFRRSLAGLLALVMVFGMFPNIPHAHVHAEGDQPAQEAVRQTAASLSGKTISILGDSISTYSGVSNNTAYNSTLGGGAIYYTPGRLGVNREDTWWQQTIDALGLELLVNNSWSGSCVFTERSGTVAAYLDRCTQLHNDVTMEEPDIIVVYLGTNDFGVSSGSLGSASAIDYDTLFSETNGSYTYATPTTVCEAYAIMLHKMTQRYPDAEVYCFTLLPRINQSAAKIQLAEQFNADLSAIAANFGAYVVDLYHDSGIKADQNFQYYVADNSLHPGPAGMDAITGCFTSAMLKNSQYSSGEVYDVSYELNDVLVAQGTAYAVCADAGFTVDLVAGSGYVLDVKVIMGGKDITDSCYADGRISIDLITGDLEIQAQAKLPIKEPEQYRWEFDGTELVNVSGQGYDENLLTRLAGTVTDGVHSKSRFQLSKKVVLYHDRPWVLEWKSEGTWTDTTDGALLFAGATASATTDTPYLYRRHNSDFIALGVYTGGKYHNYGVSLGSNGMDATQEHVYRLENRISTDGSNMVYLYVDDVEIGAMNHHWIGGTDQKETVDWLNGQDLVFSYMGTTPHAIGNCSIDYIQVWENGEPKEALPLRYDDHYDVTGKTVEILDTGTPGDAVVTQDGDTLIATGIGTAKVRIDGQLYEVTVEKAKLNIVVIMGQSNAGNHFANATSDITCPAGTAYWWGNGQGTAATEPVAYTQPSMGFHTPLLAELYAQSVAAGDPVKNVMIWHEGITSKNGQSIVKWAASADDTSGTDATVIMIENCLAYYAQHTDKYEIVSKGVYWLQGESDTQMDPAMYTQRFMAMWGRLKAAGMEYLAFLRVRRGTTQNDADHQDLYHSASLSAQIRMVNDNPDMFMATTLTENWVGTADTVHTVDISQYITLMQTYGGSASHTDSYGNDATFADGKLTTTMKTLYGSNNKCHYGKFGYALIGADAAYHMYRALHGTDGAIVVTDTSGYGDACQLPENGQQLTLDITDMAQDLSFRAACGSAAGTLQIRVYSAGREITEEDGVVLTSGQHYGSVSAEALRQLSDVTVEAVYTTLAGKTFSVLCSIVCAAPQTQTDYIWTFDEDLKARDPEGNVVNSFLETALQGSYTLENGYLNAELLQLELENMIQLHANKNWSVEWKFGSLDGGNAGFLLCSAPGNTVGNKGIYHVDTGVLMLSDYADSTGYRNYTSCDVTVADYDCLRITNTYDPNTGKSQLSLWQNGKLVIENFQLKGSINKGEDTTDMTSYPLGGDFTFRYMGNAGRNTWKVNCQLDYLKISFGDQKEESYTLPLRYDDHYDVTGKTVQILDAGTPASYKVGSGIVEGTLDDAVITLAGNYLIATGIGTAKVRIDGAVYEITVEPAPISLFMITGHSMGAGQQGNKDQSVVCPAGQVYSSHGTTNLGSATAGVGISYAAGSRAGNINAFTADGTGTIGEGSALAYEWNRLTGEKVWVLNTSVGGSCLAEWIPGTSNYSRAVTQFRRAQQILSNEIRAGHYTLSHMGLVYHNGANFSYKGVTFTQQDLRTWYDAMWTGFRNELSTDLDGNGKTETVSFLGFVPIWTKSAGISYTQDEPAGLYMAASAAYEGMFTASVIGQDWLTDANVAARFPAIDYQTQNGQPIKQPEKTSEVFSSDNVHYLQVGYNAVGMDIAKNIVSYLQEEQTLTQLKLVNPGDLSEISDQVTLNYGQEFVIVPLTEPITFHNLTFTAQGNIRITYPLVISATGNGTGKLTISCEGKLLREITFTCTDAPQPQTLALRYDDHYDVTGKTVEIVDAGKPTSYQVGYGVEENTVFDTAVVTLRGNTLVATGIGEAQVKIDGVLYEVTVTAAPISLLLLIGQSNMRGSEGNADQSIVCPDGMVYATFGDDRGDAAGIMNVNNATKFAASALTGPYSTVNVEGTTEHLSFYPINSLTAAGAGTFGPDSGFAYEWVKQTGEKVWIVNAAHGGSSIKSWAEGAVNFRECDLLFSACQETLRKEIAAGHFTLSHMGYFWCQGCSDYSWTAEEYVQKYLAMHEGLKRELAFDHDSDPSTADRTLEFAGIIPIRAGHDYNDGYREGTYTDTTGERFYESFQDLQMTGPRVAQYWMTNNPELPEIWNVCNIGEDWVWMPDGTNGVTAYFQAHYPGGTVDYTTQVKQSASWYTPTTPKAVHDSIHYNQIGYNEWGREAARNALILLGEIEAPEVETKVELLTWDGYTPASQVTASVSGNSGTLVVPKVYPVWKSKEVTYSLSEGLLWNYYDLLVTDDSISGKLTSNAANQVVTVTGHTWSDWETLYEPSPEGPGQQQRVCADCGLTESKTIKGVWQIYALNDHLLELPEYVCCDTNLWAALPHESVHFTSGKTWGSTGTPVTSITIPVNAGDKLYATSWKKAVENGHATSNGIRVTFFNASGIAKTMGPGQTDREFYANGGYLIAPEGTIAINIAMWYDSEDYEVYILSREHCYEKGICLGCGAADPDAPAVLELRFDDHYDITGKTAEIIDAGKPTSYKVGYGVPAGTLDDAVVTLEGSYLVATGIGTAQVKIDGVLYEVTVTAAPLNVLLLIGQSNMQGSEGNAEQSIVCPEGMVYATYGDRYTMTTSNATNFAPSALTGTGSAINVNGTTANIKDWPVYLLNEAGNGKIGPDSGFAYEWVKQTGQKVWVINAAHGGTAISLWQENGKEYKECKLLFNACMETLRAEIEAGHFTLSHMGYFWCQGCSDYSQTAQWYVEKYLAMHENLKTELAFSEEITFEFAGIIPVRAGHEYYTSYRQGVYADTTNKAYHESFKDLRFTGPRVAQYWMTNNPDLPEIWNVCNIGEDWVWMPDGTNGVTEYFQAHYPGGTVDYTTQVQQSASWYTPTTPKAVHDSIHYNQIGYNEVGREAARNALIMLGEIEAPVVETKVELLTWDGYTPADEIIASTTGSSGTLVVPKVYPVWKSKEVTYQLSEGLTWSYYDLLAADTQMSGTLTAVGAEGSVSVVKAEPYSHFLDHVAELPEDLCCGLNLWNVLEHDKEYYANGTGWGIHNSGNVPSVTIFLNPGDKLYATSFGKAGTNGSNSTNGIRMTYFSEYGVVKTLAPADAYKEFTANGGYLIAPEGTVAVNIPMWSNSDQWEIYILNREHDQSSDICSICGKNSHTHSFSEWETVTAPSIAGPGEEKRSCPCGESESREVKGVWQTLKLSDHMAPMPDVYCSGTNLWAAMEHDPEFFSPGTEWHVHSSGTVYSVTIPVNAGDKIYASSFGKGGTHGSSSNGIRVTFFDAKGMNKTLEPAQTYAEFTANGGYLIAPEGTVAINIPMWTNSDQWEIYILNLSHDTVCGICSACGKDTHSWSAWETVTLPSMEGPGEEKRTCVCGETETRRVDGAWQKYDLANHMQTMPENYCCATNLWTALDHDAQFLYGGTHWAVHESGTVYSVTIPAKPGDRIFATSFQEYGKNGNSYSTSSGIRVTFLDAYGVAKTLDPAGTYAEFTKNGGYLIAPEGTVAVNIPMWNGSDSNEIYILDREHIPGTAVKEETADGSYELAVYCACCGCELSREAVAGHIPGDITGDGVVNNKDLTRLFKYLTGYDVEVVEAALDINGDGSVNNKDQTRLFRYLSGYDVDIY